MSNENPKEKIDRFDGEYDFLSNFYMSPVTYAGMVYPSSEHAFQAAKFGPYNTKLYIAGLKTPGEAKKAGRKPGIRQDWDDVRLEVMKEIVYNKFSSSRELAEKLLATDKAELIEGNTWGDKFWGTVDGVGENHLGKILMKVRKELGQVRALAWAFWEMTK